MTMEWALLPLFCCVWVGFGLLSLTQDRHYESVTGATDVPTHLRHGLRVGGWLLLTATLALALWLWGVGIGITAWVATLTAAAIVQALLLTYRPQALQALWAKLTKRQRPLPPA